VSRSSGPLSRAAARRSGALALAVALGLLTACSDAEDTTGSGSTTSAAAPTSSPEASPTDSAAPSSADAPASQTLTATEGEMFIEVSEDALSAGSYTIEVVNEGSGTHDLVVERDGNDVASTDDIAPGSSTTLTVDLEPGEYVFYCSVANHRAMGMEVTVTVT
jgi:plastocyanin